MAATARPPGRMGTERHETEAALLNRFHAFASGAGDGAVQLNLRHGSSFQEWERNPVVCSPRAGDQRMGDWPENPNRGERKRCGCLRGPLSQLVLALGFEMLEIGELRDWGFEL